MSFELLPSCTKSFTQFSCECLSHVCRERLPRGSGSGSHKKTTRSVALLAETFRLSPGPGRARIQRSGTELRRALPSRRSFLRTRTFSIFPKSAPSSAGERKEAERLNLGFYRASHSSRGLNNRQGSPRGTSSLGHPGSGLSEARHPQPPSGRQAPGKGWRREETGLATYGRCCNRPPR